MSDELEDADGAQPELPLPLTPDMNVEPLAPPVAAVADEIADAPAGPKEPAETRSPASGISVAIGFLTRLPFGPSAAPASGALARAMGWFPLVGVVVGGIGGAIYAAAH